MKIGIDIRNIGKHRTGDEVVFFNLTKSLADLDRQNNYFLCTDITDPIVLADIADRLGLQDKPNFEIVSLKTKNRYTWNFWALPRYLRQNPVDIYLTQYITPFFVPKKIKIATVVHDVSFKVYRKFIRFSDLFFLDILIPLSFKRADKIIGVSKFTADEIIKYYKTAPEKVSWIHNAVGDNFKEAVSPQEIDAVRKKYNLPEKFILYIGTLQPRKNLPALITAYSTLAEDTRAKIKLVLAGGKGHNYDPGIEKSIAEYSLEKDVFLPGFIDEKDKPAIFMACHVFCNPSFYEGFGITILEAMTLGIPVLASMIPPHQEVAENSVSYFNPEDTEELTRLLASVIADENLRNELAHKELIQTKKFSWETTSQKLLELFNNLNNPEKKRAFFGHNQSD
ncbi:MAG: glycosyltransferase family 1 protein [Parcubacteria group bacterium]|jgi:glycosyltransferase involved in cell wall biosynthesis